MVSGKARRSHLYEIDLVRVVTAICVVGVHSVYFALYLPSSPLGFHAQNAVVAALHFTREVFLAITAFVMVHAYAHRPFPFWTFWQKRGLGVLLPYIFWSLFYVWIVTGHDPLGEWLWTSLVGILTGTASFQLYFILLSLEFYLVLPLFLPLIDSVGERHPWRLLIGSAVLQFAMLYVNYNYVQVGPFAETPAGQLINRYQAAFLPLYQFYAVLGGVAAHHAERLQSFVRSHGRWIVASMVLGLAVLWVRYAVAVGPQQFSYDYATSVFQPVMVFYSAATALFLYWLGVIWANHRSPDPPRGLRLNSLLSDASFGIYLIHPLVLGQVLNYLPPMLPSVLPTAIQVATIWAATAGLSAAICIVMLYIPVLSRLIGRSAALPKEAPWIGWPTALPLIHGQWLASRRNDR